MEPLLETHDLALKVGRKFIFKDVNLLINEDKNLVLFGLNGCGKTTLLSALAGYQSSSNGELIWHGTRITQENTVIIRKGIGFVSSSFFSKVFFSEVVLDIVLSGKFASFGIQGEVNGEDVRKAKALLNIFGLKRKARYPYNMLSKGQQQVVLIARALMSEPKFLLLDEPCSGLDIIAKERFMLLVKHLVEQYHLTLLYVTHQPDEISSLFSEAALMKDGTIFSQGEVENLFNDEMITDFLGVKASCFYSKNRLFIDVDFEDSIGW